MHVLHFRCLFRGEKVGKRVPGRAVAAAFSTTEDRWLIRFSTDVRRRVGTFFTSDISYQHISMCIFLLLILSEPFEWRDSQGQSPR